MADSAFQIQYRQEFIAQFEQGVSWLRTVCTTEAVIKGNQAMFLVAGSGGGSLSAGRHIRYPKDTPLTNLYVSLLDRMGAKVKSFGDSQTAEHRGYDGRLPGL